MRSIIPSLVILVAVSFSGGCATILSNSSYPVTIDTNPSGAAITIKDKKGDTVHKGTTPTMVNLKAGWGYFSPARYTIEATFEGHEPIQQTFHGEFDAWYLGNFIFGGLIGFLIVDPLTGAMWTLDDRVVVTLGSEEDPPAALASDTAGSAPSTHDGEVQQAPGKRSHGFW